MTICRGSGFPPATTLAVLPVALCLIAGRAEPGLAQPPQLSDTVFLPGDADPAPAIGRQSDPAIAAGDGQSLVVWVDDRTSMQGITNFFGAPAYAHHTATKWDIYAARLDAAGNLIDQTPIIVTQELLMQGMPDVAWNGENWLVIWSGERGLECCPTNDIYAARVSPSGQVLDDPPIVVDTDPTSNGLLWPAVTSDGTNWVVVWRDLDEGAGIFTLDATRIAPDGTVLDPGGVNVRHDNHNSYPVDPDIVWAGDEFLLVWEEGSGGVTGQRLTPDLQRVGAVFTINAASWVGFNPRVATDGTDYFVTWWSRPPGQVFQLAGARVTHGGVVLDPSPILLTAATDGTNYEPAVAWDGTQYVVAYERRPTPDGDLFAARVTTAGTVLDFDTNAIPVATEAESQFEAAITTAPGGNGTVIAWRDNRYLVPFSSAASGDVFAAGLTPGGVVGAEAAVALGAPRQTLLRLIPNDTGYLAVFRSETSPVTRILAQRVDMSGTAIDPEPVEVTAGTNRITSPSAAWNGSVYLVVWENRFTEETSGRRLAADLTPLDPTPISIMPGNWPDVAAIGDIFLTVTSWEEPHEIRAIYSTRVRGTDGAVLDPSPRVVGSNYAVLPRIGVVGDRWLAVWQRHPTHDDPNSTARANFVTLDNNPGSYFTVDFDARSPVVAGGPDQGLIVVDGRNGSQGRDIYARRIDSSGTLLDPDRGITISSASRDQFDPAAAWDGDEYVTAFSDFRNAATEASPSGDIYGARVADTGTVLDPSGFAIADTEIPERYASVAGRSNEFLLGGSIFRPEPGYGNYRIGLRASAATTGLTVEPIAGGSRPLLRVSNPMSHGPVRISLELNAGDELSVAIFDVTGRKLSTLFEGRAPTRFMRLSWDGRDRNGGRLGGGVYFIAARSGAMRQSVRVVRF